MKLGVVLAAMLVAGPVWGQERVTAPTDPLAVPGDYMDIPQDAQLKVPLGPPAGKRPMGPPPAMGPSAASPSYAQALKAATVAVERCKANGFSVAVAVTDAGGTLKVALAPDGTRNNGVFMAMRKAVTVAGFGVPTLEVRRRIEKDASVRGRVTPNMVLLPGGMPILQSGKLVGAIGVSGASAFVEEKCAEDGLRAAGLE